MDVLEFRLGDVRRFEDLTGAVRDADIVVNAAALKQAMAGGVEAHAIGCEVTPEFIRATRKVVLRA